MNPSIVTLTLSPALDLSTATATVAPTHKLRCDPATEQPGGGGVNVARVATRLGAETVAILALGGPTGARINELLRGEGVATVQIAVAANSRQSFSISEQATGDQYRFVLPSQPLLPIDLAAAIQVTRDAAEGAACIVISGQTPPGVDAPFFNALVDAVAPTPVIIDTSGPALEDALQSGATLVKPSARELSSIVGIDLATEVEVLEAVRGVHAESNVETLVVSIGSGGAFSVGPDGVARRFRAPSVRVVSAIGAGDAMVGGVAVALSRGADIEAALSLGIAAGAATVLTEGTDLCQASDVDRLGRLVNVEAVQ